MSCQSHHLIFRPVFELPKLLDFDYVSIFFGLKKSVEFSKACVVQGVS